MWLTLSVRDYLHERAAESRHNEMSAYLMFIAGSIMFVGGILETLFVAELVDWVLFVPIGFSATPGCILGLTLTLSGLALMGYGLVAGTYFARNRTWYMHELGSTSSGNKGIIARRRNKKRRISAPSK